MRVISACAVLLAALLGAACAHRPPTPDATTAQDARRPVAHGRLTDHVLIVSIDGLRPDAIERFNAATLQRLMHEGSYSRDAQTILPSTTLPSHTSMLTGVDVDVHHVTGNSDETSRLGPVTVPTVFGLAHTAGFRTAAFFGKAKLQQLHVPHTLDYVGLLDDRVSWFGSARRTMRELDRHLARESPNLLFIHLAEPDYAGHLYGWMGGAYARAVIEADRAVALLIERADATFGPRHYTMIVTADHGGHGRTHGTADPVDTTIPWIVWGQGVRSGVLLAPVHTTDTAATALWLLGVAVPTQWTGRSVGEAFDTTAVAPVP
jgi:predicted AlkP superfamily pyrophosphatase or phosphodiesterase